MSNNKQTKQGRLVKNVINPIDDTFQNIAKTIMTCGQKKTESNSK